jgi:hypothetical protein
MPHPLLSRIISARTYSVIECHRDSHPLLSRIISARAYSVQQNAAPTFIKDHFSKSVFCTRMPHTFFILGSSVPARNQEQNAAHYFRWDPFSMRVFCTRMPHTFYIIRHPLCQRVIRNRMPHSVLLGDHFSKRVFLCKNAAHILYFGIICASMYSGTECRTLFYCIYGIL